MPEGAKREEGDFSLGMKQQIYTIDSIPAYSYSATWSLERTIPLRVLANGKGILIWRCWRF